MGTAASRAVGRDRAGCGRRRRALADRVGRPPNAGALVWTLLGLASLAVGTVLHSRVRSAAGPASVAATELVAAFAVLGVWAPLRGSVAIPLTGHALGTFAWLAIVTGVGAPLLLFALIRGRGATRASSSYLFSVPAVTAIAAWPILGVRLGVLTLVGLVIVAIALRLGRPRPQPPQDRRSDAYRSGSRSRGRSPGIHCRRATVQPEVTRASSAGAGVCTSGSVTLPGLGRLGSTSASTAPTPSAAALIQKAWS